MLFDPTERNVDPFLFPARIRTMQALVLTLAILDKNVTMAKAAQVSFIVRTGLTPPSCQPRRAKLLPKASTGHTSPFKPNGERKLQHPSPPKRRKCAKIHPQSPKY